MQLFCVKTGEIRENTYFVVQDNQDTLIFDPGNDAEQLKQTIETHGFNPVAILLTHAHYDHIGAVDVLRQEYDIPVYVNAIEKEFLMNPELNLSGRHFPNLVSIQPADKLWETMGQAQVGTFTFRIEHVPGHSPGSTVYLFEQDQFAIVGDTLFKGGCGRTDLPGSSTHTELMQGIRQHLLTLPDDTQIFAGHGEPTTIAFEKKTNPYLNGVVR
ncbi:MULTISPECIES: MBL fold metallo-hydrolase [unclassified Granulicatella]|uniref:MBL fold metallo-hydrolase n=1 Tax=unclassified Granulicatella TaxID=2630493 RepID=UPI001073A615|nr:MULTISPECIES: MBL fold metallo-hydrolase [unclassified Granulicatella]MBF0779698.1 MBL fold metallo-hydrolase [Granulicatella sp. 19428wC4_WM01]TFU96220.1 MBL fold metallo-hydrolase [Granulicatella sp. WM01]